MSHAAQSHDQAESVTANVRYLIASGEKPIYKASQGGRDARLDMVGEFESRAVEIHNGRTGPDGSGRAEDYTLDRHGFALTAHPSSAGDFYDPGWIKSVYDKDCEALLLAETGARRVVVFDHTLRADSPETRDQRQTREPASVIHNDYTERSAPKRVRDLLGDEAETLLERRFAIVNIWRPLSDPVLSSPLALCEADSLSLEDLVASERRAKDRIGEIYMATYSPRHRWVYFPEMRPQEALLIKTYDSAEDGRARWVIHTAFKDPTTPDGAPPRESIETRCFVFF